MIDVVIPTRNLALADKAMKSCDWSESITIVSRPEFGFTAAVDQGWRGGKAELVLFLNDDCQMNIDAVSAMKMALRDPNVGIVGPTLRCGDFQSNPLAAEVPLKDGKLPDYIEVRHLIGACLMVKRSVLEEIDGWDTDYILYCSDLDLCDRAKAAGYSSVWAVNTTVEHIAHATILALPVEVRDQIINQDRFLWHSRHPGESSMPQRDFGATVYTDEQKVLTG